MYIKKNYTQLVRSFEKVWGSSSREEEKKKVAVLSFRPFQRSLPFALYTSAHTHEKEKREGLSVTVGPIFHVRYPMAGFFFYIYIFGCTFLRLFLPRMPERAKKSLALKKNLSRKNLPQSSLLSGWKGEIRPGKKKFSPSTLTHV